MTSRNNYCTYCGSKLIFDNCEKCSNKIWDLPSDDEIDRKIKSKWGISRIYRWISKRCPCYRTDLILNRILNRPNEFSSHSVYRARRSLK
ncbi:hypothetical protein HN865_04190 [Candidatus Woesearchaeota archaeon]|nr:hypothetical protein [Candidatus Woesearchaeota archaeon]MBT7238029.1 hypothetical protein [Candidatus Woesearchaeota archaeon]